ncbi:GNAT family N-acetyltransferase [Qipengyuania soli]|uniref:GNAT family N-acetyltransferase n=1 Tax=Qipengyuania soli TaxID=2782568 RepID=A0A7S8F629_9SPHN|nr:GNAT family N-acetyltransferase [Qipengyuania soli]QPC99914.1 GNAT family N-acetyltransferase [Qipengyuania soli]
MASQSESGIATRPATLGDIPEIVGILGAYRDKLAHWSPQFWRPAPGSAAMTTMYLGSLVGKEEHIFLVAEEAGAVIGFALALETPAPPVYAPGDTGTLDDFAVLDDERWEEVAGALLAAIVRNAKKLGWKQLIAVSPKADDLKNRLLEEAGLVVASQWWTTKL